MRVFRPALAAGDPRPIDGDVVRATCADVMRAGHFFVALPLRIRSEPRPDEETHWEIFSGRLLDETQTRERRRFEAWSVYLVDPTGMPSAEPVVSLKFDTAGGRVYCTRAILCHAHETYDAGDNVLLTREVQRWQRELVGVAVLDDLPDAGALRDELACLVFQAVVGTNRLPLTSIETPLPGFALGQLANCYRPSAVGGPMTTPDEWAAVPGEVELAPAERPKHLEFVLRASAMAAGSPPANVLQTLREVFNAVTLSPYTDFVARVFAALRRWAADGPITEADRIDFLAHLVRQLWRHLTAYDLVTFHHRGSNYPDALLLDDLTAELLSAANYRPNLFVGDDRPARLRRRAVRQCVLLRLQYAGHPVPDAPTSPGENLRVLPDPFARVPEEQILSPKARRRQLFIADLPADPRLLRDCFADLERPEERFELGTALFLDRPLGFAKAPGEPDQTWLASHLSFSRSIADGRLRLLESRGDWLPPGAVDRWQQDLAVQAVEGLPLRNTGPPARPGVVSLHDALRVADDFVFLRTTRRALTEFAVQYRDVLPPGQWRLLIPGGTAERPTLSLFDERLSFRVELAADVSRGYRTRGGAETVRAGFRQIS